MEQDGYAKDYSDQSFWDKVKKHALDAGKGLIELALQLYYALQAPETPTWAKSVIIAALGYFISPLDAIPDVIPVVGYADDLGALVMAVASVATYITEDMKTKAKAKCEDWFAKA